MEQGQKAKRKLRIAQVASLWAKIPPVTYGGIELVIKLLIDELIKQGHEVTLFGTGDSQTSANLRAVTPRNVLDAMATGEAASYEYYANASVVDALRAAEEFDVIHFHIGNQFIPMSLLTKTPSLHTLHTFLIQDDEWILRRYPTVPVSAISQYQLRSVGRQVPVIYNGIDFDSFTPGLEPGKYLAFLGRMSYDKNPLDAIRVAKKLGMPILLAGKAQSGKEEKYYQENIVPLIDNESVRFIGLVNHEQKNELLRNAAALLFPVQWEEPFGLVMIEAMACGTPVVAHNLGSVAEVVDQGITGYHTSRMEELADLTLQALKLDRAEVRRHAMSRFGCQRMAADYLRLYLSLLEA
jgi:glycosyltransferase involved in cell wall biosynthesis